jgi:hypothetical protein
MEDNNEVLEQEAETTESSFDAFNDAWDDDYEVEDATDDHDDDGQEADDTEPTDEPEDADQAEENADEAETSSESGEESKEGNQLYEITYLGNKEQLTLEQMTELAQKGRDYDHIRQERDKLKGESGRQLDFLKKLADKAGVSVEEQIELTEAMWLMDEEAAKGNTISEAEALLRIQRDRGKTTETAENTGDSEAPAVFNKQIDRFLEVYPTVTGDQIPQEVWDETKRNGGDLLVAYQAYMIKALKAENAKNAQEKTNNKNKTRSTGPLNSAGAGKKRSAFDEGWDSDD